MKEEFTAFIVDDELEIITYLKMMLNEVCPEIKVVGNATGAEEALNGIFRKHPDLVFLDIQLDEKSGFDLLQELNEENLKPYIIFVTAYEQFALEAFQANALDYLLKPVKKEDLLCAVNRYKQMKRGGEKQDFTPIYYNSQKIRFNTSGGFFLLSSSEILYCEADRNYTKIYTAPDEFKLVSLNLAEVQRRLPEKQFWRISRFHVVNSDFVSEVKRVKRKCSLIFEKQVIELTCSRRFPDELV